MEYWSSGLAWMWIGQCPAHSPFVPRLAQCLFCLGKCLVFQRKPDIEAVQRTLRGFCCLALIMTSLVSLILAGASALPRPTQYRTVAALWAICGSAPVVFFSGGPSGSCLARSGGGRGELTGRTGSARCQSRAFLTVALGLGLACSCFSLGPS